MHATLACYRWIILNENGISIKYEPFREIVIMERTRFPTPDKLARFVSIIAGGKLAGLYWVDGIVFLYFPLPAPVRQNPSVHELVFHFFLLQEFSYCSPKK